jgi:putative glutamine amidotransferase
MVQAIKRTGGPFMIGVQWHPELLVFDRGEQRLFHRLVDAACEARATRTAATAPAPT